MRVLATDRLTLEPQVQAHADEMFVVLSDPAIYEFENAPPVSIEWLRARFARLESRSSQDGTERWLNWVIRLASTELAGYVQATVRPDGRADIAYELSSKYWGRGLARTAVEAMIDELAAHYSVVRLSAVVKCENSRSRRLLERLGFAPAQADDLADWTVDPDEIVMLRELML